MLLITHEFDDNCLFLTAPVIFHSKYSYPEFKTVILDAMMEKKSVGSQQEKPYNKLAEALMIFKEKHETKPESS